MRTYEGRYYIAEDIRIILQNMKDKDCYCKDKGVIELLEIEHKEAYAQGWNEGQLALKEDLKWNYKNTPTARQKTYEEGRLDGVSMVYSLLYVVDEEDKGDLSKQAIADMYTDKLEAFYYGMKQYETEAREAIKELEKELEAHTPDRPINNERE